MTDLLSGEEYESLPLREVVFKTIRKSILKGELSPGDRLMEIQLAKKLGVSRTPIREAIRKLELEGLVVMIPRKGAVVAGITEKSLRDVLEVRRALEELAITLACVRMSDDEIEELKHAEEDFQKAIEKAEPILIAGADERFHDIIFNGTRNEKLVLMLNNLRENMYRYRLEYVKNPEQWKLLLEEHDEMFAAIQSRDIEKAKLIIGAHISNQEIAVARSINGK